MVVGLSQDQGTPTQIASFENQPIRVLLNKPHPHTAWYSLVFLQDEESHEQRAWVQLDALGMKAVKGGKACGYLSKLGTPEIDVGCLQMLFAKGFVV